MIPYRIYFKDLTDRITSPPVEATFSSADDAMAAARQALERSAFSFVEVWCGPKLLARFGQQPTTAA